MNDVQPSALRPKPLLEFGSGPDARIPIGRPPRQRPWRALAWATALLLIIGSIGAVGFTLWDRRTIHAGGPVALDGGIYGQSLSVGEPTAFEGVMLRNAGTKPAVLERVRVLGVTGGFEVLGVRTRPWPVSPEAYASAAQGFPPTGTAPAALDGNPVVPVAKARPGSGDSENAVQLVIGARAAAPGVARARGVQIRYRVGHRRYRRSTDASMYLCAPSERFTAEQSCPGDAEGRFADVVVDYPAGR